MGRSFRFDINWSRHLLELVVVFISVTLAFTLNSWRENEKDHQLEQKYLSSFYDDVSTDLDGLKNNILQNEKTNASVERLIALLQSGQWEDDSILVILGSMSQYVQFTPNFSTYESIKYSGNLSLLSNYYLKEELIKYYQQYEDKKLIDAVYNNYIDKYFIPFVYENLDFISQRIVNKKALKTHQFGNLVGGYYQLLKQNLAFYINLEKMGLELKQKLKEEIHRK